MMNTKRILDEEKLKDFVSDFNKHFEDLAKRYKNDAEKIEKRREYFWRKYPEIFNDSSENEVEMNIDEGKTRPKKPNLDEIKERLLRNRTTEAFTDYRGVESDPNLTLVERMIKLQKAIDDVTRRKIHYASLLGELLQSCFKKNQRKPTRKHWSRPRLKGGGHSSYVNCTNSLINTNNLPSALYLFVLFVITLKR